MRTAVVTGSGSGLGRAIAIELCRRGYRVHLTDVDAGAADRAAAELGGEARGTALDVRDEAACRALAERSPTPVSSTSGSTTPASSSAGHPGSRAGNSGS